MFVLLASLHKTSANVTDLSDLIFSHTTLSFSPFNYDKMDFKIATCIAPVNIAVIKYCKYL